MLQRNFQNVKKYLQWRYEAIMADSVLVELAASVEGQDRYQLVFCQVANWERVGSAQRWFF